MDERGDMATNNGAERPSLLLAAFGFMASTATIVGLMTALSSMT